MLLNVKGSALDVNMKTIAALLFLLSGCSYSRVAGGCDEAAGHAALYSNNERIRVRLEFN